MIVNNNTHINSPVRQVHAMVDVLRDSTIAHTWTNNDRIIKITLERPIDETKFFGYGICQKVNVHLIDRDKEITDCVTSDLLDVKFTTEGDEFIPILPYFKILRCNRDENTNELSITAYDAIYGATEHTYAELNLPDMTKEAKVHNSFTLGDLIEEVARVLNLTFIRENHSYLNLDIVYDNGVDAGGIYVGPNVVPNYIGRETLRDVLDDIAEITQTIYFLTHNNELVFKRLDVNGEAAHTIDKSQYITLSSSDNRRLAKLVHTNELGDNVSVELAVAGTTQYINDNPLWNLRPDIEELMYEALDAVGDLTINQFDCSWRGNWYLEIGDKIGLVNKEDEIVYAYLLNDTWEYNGAFNQKTIWRYTDNDTNGAVNPLPLGERLKDTYAKVDKVNQEIVLLSRDVTDLTEEFAQLTLTTEAIYAIVEDLDTDGLGAIQDELAQLTVTSEAISQRVTAHEVKTNEMNQVIEDLANTVESKVSATEVEIIVQETVKDGITSVTTETGFTFDKDGMTIEKTGSEMSTQVTEDGMTISRSGDVVLTVNNTGVQAANLHATTYLIIGGTSRFEDYEDETNYWSNTKRTGCFWIYGSGTNYID